MVLSQDDKKAKAVGINHIALEVGDIDEPLEFYSSFIDFEISRRSETAAFVYFGDQFINFILGRNQAPDERRHFGIAVDDKELARETLENMGIKKKTIKKYIDKYANNEISEKQAIDILSKDAFYSKAESENVWQDILLISHLQESIYLQLVLLLV